MGNALCKFYDDEIELVIAEYLLAQDSTGRMPADVAREIVEVARVAVPKVRKQGCRALDRTKLSTAVGAALEKLRRNEPLRRPVTPQWLKKHLAAFDEFVANDARLANAHNLCLHHELDVVEGVLEDFLREKGLPEMDLLERRMETYKLVKFLRERRGHVPLTRRRECRKEEGLAYRVGLAFRRGGELAACRLMTDIEHRYGNRVASLVWYALIDIHDDEEHPYFQDSGEGDGREWRPRLRLVGREG